MVSSNIYYNNGHSGKDLAINFELLKLAFDSNQLVGINLACQNIAYDYLALRETFLCNAAKKQRTCLTVKKAIIKKPEQNCSGFFIWAHCLSLLD